VQESNLPDLSVSSRREALVSRMGKLILFLICSNVGI